MCPWNKWTILQDLVLAVVINTSAMALSGVPFSIASWFPGTSTAFCTNVLLQLVLPVPAAGRAASRCVEDRSWRPLLSVFVENLIFVTLISLTMAFMQTEGVHLVQVWLATYPQLVCIGYATSLALFAAGRRRALAA